MKGINLPIFETFGSAKQQGTSTLVVLLPSLTPFQFFLCLWS